MSISILGGEARGFSLVAPNSKSVRPTSVLLKRRFFDSHQKMQDQTFIDVCAGSGSVGFEALSRGAASVTLVESSAQALKCIKQNKERLASKFDLPGTVEVVKADCVKWLSSYSVENAAVDFLFFDPPYEQKELYQKFLSELKQKKELFSKFVMEFCRQKTAPEEEVQSWLGMPDKSYRQGTSFLYIYDFS